MRAEAVADNCRKQFLRVFTSEQVANVWQKYTGAEWEFYVIVKPRLRPVYLAKELREYFGGDSNNRLKNKSLQKRRFG